ncbi:MAG: LuxR C-terminal-related transcriptional regulator [Nocardioidaceae bacterium]
MSRPRLLAALDRDAQAPLVLVSAPAGAGKTSLVADWVSHHEDARDRTAWITFEEGEHDFWPAVRTALLDLGVDVPSPALPRGSRALDRRVLTALAAATARHPARLTVVIDGHELSAAPVANDVDFLLRHSGHRLQIVVVTRADPILPLYRYRLQDKLVELRMADLAFTDEEAAELLTSMDVKLAPEAVHALNARTRGWAAGLRFAARILADSAEPDKAVADVVGDRGNIAEYLLGEVVDAQTPEVRRLLLDTSVPETLQPGLVEELGGRSAPRALDQLARGNAFVEPVPQHPGYYRYYPFFRELLRAELAYESPEHMADLQRRAAEWFAREGMLTAAVGHYAAIDAWADAASQVVDALAVGRLLVGGTADPLARVLRPIPDDVADPAVDVVRATLALVDGDLERCDDELGRATAAQEHAPVPEESALALAVTLLRATWARYAADPETAGELAAAAEHVLAGPAHQAAAEANPELTPLVHLSVGLAALRRGELGQAGEAFTAGSGAAAGAACEPLLAESLGYLACVLCCQGRLTKAAGLAARAVAIFEHAGIGPADRSPAAHVALGWVGLEQYDLQAAGNHLELAGKSHLLAHDSVSRTLLALVRARLQFTRGTLPDAISTVEEAATTVAATDRWLGDRLRLEEAALRASGGEREALTALKLGQVARRDAPEVALVRAVGAAQAGEEAAAGRTMSRVLVRSAPLQVQVSGLLLEAELQLRRGSADRARAALERSLRLASTERLRRPFREAVPSVQQMLARDHQLVADHGWLTGTRGRPPRSQLSPRQLPQQRQHPPTPAFTDAAPVVEELTEKELEVLGHLAELLTTEEIASTMFVSVNTIRTHVRSILRKLGVSRRNAAVRRARELRMLSR